MPRDKDFAIDELDFHNEDPLKYKNRRRSSKISKPRQGSRQIRKVVFNTTFFGVLVGLIVVAVLYSKAELENQELKATTTTTAIPTAVDRPLYWRLNPAVIPLEYTIELSIDLPLDERDENNHESFTSRGNVEIKFESLADNVSEFQLHARTIVNATNGYLTVDPSNVVLKLGEHNVDLEVVFQPQADILIILLTEPLQKNQMGKLRIDFTGVISESDRTWYERQSGRPWVLSTHLQPYNTRRLFPCFDEPGFKATFKISLEHDSRFQVVRSSSPIESQQTLPNSRTVTSFAQTPKIAPHSVALFIGTDDFDSRTLQVDYSPTEKQQVTVIGSRIFLAQTNFVLEQVARMSKSLGETFTRTSEKLDIVLVRNLKHISSSGWGLVFFREEIMIIDKNSSAVDRMKAEMLLGYEIAGTLFGSMVTAGWWDNTWLNEGFARFIQHDVVGRTNPEYKPEQFFPLWVTRYALKQDSHRDAFALNKPSIENLNEIDKMIGGLAREKGAAILQMIRGVIGRDKFKTAQINFVSRHKMGNANHLDFIREFEAEAGGDLKGRLNGWITQSGYPVLKLERKLDNITFSQESFLWDNLTDKIWHIPLTLQTDFPHDFNFWATGCWLENKSGNLKQNCPKMKMPTRDQWFIGNVNQNGYYRVDYDVDNWLKLTFFLKTENFGGIDEVARGQLLDDAFNLAQSGKFNVNFTTALGLTQYLGKEKEYTPLATAMNALKYIDTLLRNMSDYDKAMLKYMQDCIYGDLYLPNASMWLIDTTNSSSKNSFKRSMYNREVVKWACFYELPVCIDDAKLQMDAWRKGAENPFAGSSYTDDFLNTMLCYAVRGREPPTKSNDTNWKYLRSLLTPDMNTNHKLIILQALGCIRTVQHLKMVFDLILDQQLVKREYMSMVLEHMSKFREGVPLVWDFIRKHWNNLPSDRGNMLISVASHFSSQPSLIEVERFYIDKVYEAYEDEKGPRFFTEEDNAIFEKAIFKVKANIEWIAKHGYQVKRFFNLKSSCDRGLFWTGKPS